MRNLADDCDPREEVVSLVKKRLTELVKDVEERSCRQKAAR